MNTSLLGGSIVLALLQPLTAQDFESPSPDVRDSQQDVLPGHRPGTQRWIVHFKTRNFDLSKFRDAVYSRRPAGEVERILDGIERLMKKHQQAFIQKVEEDYDADIFAQWWLINACCIEVKPVHLPAIRKLNNVARLEPDVEWRVNIRTATNSRHHNSDYVNSVLKIDGSGVTAAVMDTGQDENMGTSGRPHRTYFKGGNINDRTGGGIGGSRLVLNRKIGALAADDANGHGTGVASVVAGANWGTSRADDGHAFGARIAGYAIANRVQGGSSSSAAMTSAWQQMARDRVANNIVASNLSYGGSPSPTNSAQQAIDSAALNADIMNCTAAGNSGSSTRGSQSNVNGLAVGAMTPNSYVMASFSSRGPISGDTARFFPDIAACGVSTVMARRDSETTDHVASGTSMASPQVCGTATLIRAANTKLTALETKSILLATTQSIAQQNASRNRNSYGMGMMRSDLAVQLALSKKNFGTGTLTTAAPKANLQFDVVAGKFYAVAVSWHRTVLNSTAWSNLDIKVNEGNNSLGESKTTRNLYEVVRFLARTTGKVTLEVNGVSLQNGSQKFSYAFTEAPRAPIAGSVAELGAGCLGTGKPAAGKCMADNETNPFRTTTTGFPNVTYLMEIVADKNLDVDGFEMRNWSRSSSASRTVNSWLYSADANGRPNQVLAQGRITFGTSVAWQKTTFNRTVQFARGTRFFIGFTNSNPTTALGITTSGNITPYWRNNGSGGSWIRFTTRPWAWRVLCKPTGNGAVPSLSTSSEPVLGSSVSVSLEGARANAPVALVTGFSSIPNGVPLPGAAACKLFVPLDRLDFFQADANGRKTHSYTLPTTPKTLIGLHYYQQFAVRDFPANAFGFALSNALDFTVGGTP